MVQYIQIRYSICGILFLLLLTCKMSSSVASLGDKDPVKATQTNAVPVTEELLTREGQAGPASPSFKIGDTSQFLVKKIYGEVKDDKETNQLDENLSFEPEDDWFLWEEESEDNNQQNPLI